MSILTSPQFLQVLDESGSINETRGMKRIDLYSAHGSLTTFSKNHSYGEYIFDWSWADAYQKYGLPYYPKLTSMVPFTPATAQHFHGPQSEWHELLGQHDELLADHSSAHFLFTTQAENHFLQEKDYLLRHSFQYHFNNEDYRDFDHFLDQLKNKKAKNIRGERNIADVHIERLTGQKLTALHAQEMHQFYLMTLQEKNAIPYLSESFFILLIEQIPHHVLYVRASLHNKVIAGALFYYDEKTLYGRYWGSNMNISHLHFELCYYQGIEFTIEKALKTFQAGAQGEHKIARGFSPTLTFSAHKIKHPVFAKLIAQFIQEEKEMVAQRIDMARKLLPFK